MKGWQFNILFFVGVGGAVLLLVGPEFGLQLSQNPTAVTGVGAILTYVLTQRKTLTHKKDEKLPPVKHTSKHKKGQDIEHRPRDREA